MCTLRGREVSGAFIMKILYLTLEKRWFIDIASGKKKEEYREVKPYWTKRLKDQGEFKWFDQIYFRNGYRPTDPFMKVVFAGIRETTISRKKHYAIKLGSILQIKNYKPVHQSYLNKKDVFFSANQKEKVPEAHS